MIHYALHFGDISPSSITTVKGPHLLNVVAHTKHSPMRQLS